jgi:hypothetical protein
MTDRTALSTGSSDTGGLFFKKQSKDSTPVMSQSDFNGGLKQPLMQKMPKMMMPGFLKSGSTSAKNLFQHQLDKGI